MWLFISWINVTSCITLICLELCARLKRVCKVEILFQQRVNSLVTEYKFGKSCKKCFVQTDFALTIIRDNKFIIA